MAANQTGFEQTTFNQSAFGKFRLEVDLYGIYGVIWLDQKDLSTPTLDVLLRSRSFEALTSGNSENATKASNLFTNKLMLSICWNIYACETNSVEIVEINGKEQNGNWNEILCSILSNNLKLFVLFEDDLNVKNNIPKLINNTNNNTNNSNNNNNSNNSNTNINSINNIQNNETKCLVDSFSYDPNLFTFMLGKQQSNLNYAMRSTRVRFIRFLKSKQLCVIMGDNKNKIEQAKEIMNVIKDEIKIQHVEYNIISQIHRKYHLKWISTLQRYQQAILKQPQNSDEKKNETKNDSENKGKTNSTNSADGGVTMVLIGQKVNVDQAKAELLSNDCYLMEFTFEEELSRFMIGRGGCNIKKAQQCEGVKRARINGNKCTIIADNEESAKKCKTLLEMEKKLINVSYYVKYELIHKNKAQKAKEYEQISGVALISNESFYYGRILGRNNNNNNNNGSSDRIVIIGNSDNVKKAEKLIETLVAEMELEAKARQEKMEQQRQQKTKERASNDDKRTNKCYFAKGSLGIIGAGGLVKKVSLNLHNNGKYRLRLTYFSEPMTGFGAILFEGNGAALLGYEKLKLLKPKFGGYSLIFSSKKRPVIEKFKYSQKFYNRDDIYQINFAFNRIVSQKNEYYTDRMTRELNSVLQMDEFIEARVFRFPKRDKNKSKTSYTQSGRTATGANATAAITGLDATQLAGLMATLTTDALDIARLGIGVNDNNISNTPENAKQRRQEKQKEIDSAIQLQMHSIFSSFDVSEVKMLRPSMGCGIGVITFKSLVDCVNALKYGKNNQYINLPLSCGIDVSLQKQKLNLEMDLECVVYVKMAVYNIFVQKLDKLKDEINHNYGEYDCVRLRIHKPRPGKDSAVIIISGSNNDGLRAARKQVQKILEPIEIECENRAQSWILYNRLKSDANITNNYPNQQFGGIGGIGGIAAAARGNGSGANTGNYIEFARYGTINIHCSVDDKERVRQIAMRIKRSLKCAKVALDRRFLLQLLRKPGYRQQIKEYKNGFDCNISNGTIRYYYFENSNAFTGFSDDNNNNNNNSNDALMQMTSEPVLDAFEQLKQANTIFLTKKEEFQQRNKHKYGNVNNNNNNNNNNDENTCGICLTEIESKDDVGNSFQFFRCRHKVHIDCFDMQLVSACQPSGRRPVSCAKCNDMISLGDISRNMESKDQFDTFLSLCCNDYIKQYPTKYRNCPTPDCKQIYINPQGTNDDDQDDDNEVKQQQQGSKEEEDKYIFNCQECLNVYCLRCEVSYHYGMSCIQYKNSSQADKLFDEFMQNYKQDSNIGSKQCPNCKLITDKLKGTCNHAECVYCKIHFCWKCLWFDKNDPKNGHKVYSHMGTQHGGFYDRDAEPQAVAAPLVGGGGVLAGIDRARRVPIPAAPVPVAPAARARARIGIGAAAVNNNNNNNNTNNNDENDLDHVLDNLLLRNRNRIRQQQQTRQNGIGCLVM